MTFLISTLTRAGLPAACVAILALLGAAQDSAAQTVGVAVTEGVRFITEPSGVRDDNNGGAGGTLTMGINTGGVDNFALLRLDPFGLSVIGGLGPVENARVIVPVRTNFTNGNHGTADDIFELCALPSTNTGWVEGTRGIGGNDRTADDGSATFLSFAQYNDDPGPPSGTTIPWMDENGQPAANFLDALDSPVSMTPGWAQGNAPDLLELPVPLAVLNDWTTNGVAGLGIVVRDNGDSRSRFVIFQDGAGLLVDLVPEPTSSTVALVGLLCGGLSRQRRAS